MDTYSVDKPAGKKPRSFQMPTVYTILFAVIALWRFDLGLPPVVMIT